MAGCFLPKVKGLSIDFARASLAAAPSLPLAHSAWGGFLEMEDFCLLSSHRKECGSLGPPLLYGRRLGCMEYPRAP